MIDKGLTYKLVRKDKNCSDEYLINFFPTEELAVKSKFIAGKEKDESYIVKPINPELITNAVYTDFDHYLTSLIPEGEMNRVMNSDSSSEIFSSFLTCNTKFYYYTSKIVPKDKIIIDIGCSYNAQSYLFVDHKKYIGVDVMEDFNGWHFEQFKAEGTDYYNMSGQQFIKEVLPTLNLNMDDVFAICNYVPDDECRKIVRETFKNCFVYYP